MKMRRFIETVVVKAQPKLRGLPYQRYIREALERAVRANAGKDR